GGRVLGARADSRQRQEPRRVVTDEVGKRLQLALAAEQRCRRYRDPARGPSRMDVERRVLLEDRALELAQRVAGLDPELLHERPARALVDGERVGLSPGAVQREHQLATQALP